MLYVILIIILLLFVKSRFLFKLRGTFYCFHVILVLWFRLSKLTLIQLQESIHFSVLFYYMRSNVEVYIIFVSLMIMNKTVGISL